MAQENERFEIIKILYESLSSEIRRIETNFITLMVPLITSLVVYGHGVKEYLSGNPKYAFTILLLATTVGILLCIVTWFMSNIFSYTHRSNQIILSNIEDKYCLYTPYEDGVCKNCDKKKNSRRILPKNWNYLEKKSICKFEPPEIYLFFKWISVVVGVGIALLSLLLFISNWEGIGKSEIIGILFIYVLVSITIILLNFRFCWSQYKTKLQELIKNLEGYCADDKKD